MAASGLVSAGPGTFWRVGVRPPQALAPEAGKNETLGRCSDFLGISVGKPREVFEIRSDCVPIAKVYLLVFSRFLVIPAVMASFSSENLVISTL